MKKTAVSLLLSLSIAHANVDQLLDNIVLGSYYQKPGQIMSTNYNTFTAGSFSFRLRQDLLNKPVFAFQPPRATLSCAGLDFDAGWLSMMNLDTLNQMLQQAGSSFMWGIVVGLIFSLPGITEAFDKLQKWGRYAQLLGQGACQAGIAAGASIGRAIFESEKTKSAERSLGSGGSSTFEEAIKNFKSYLDYDKLYGVYPYEVLYNTYSDKDLIDLIASFTGVIIWSPVDASGNPCRNDDCVENVRAVYLPPLEGNIGKLIYGGSGVEAYDCNWGVVNTPSGAVQFCTNATNNTLPTRTLSVTGGLADKERQYLRNIVDKVKTGQPLSTQEQNYLLTHPISGIISVLNYLAVQENAGLPIDSYLQDLAYLSAGLKLLSLIATVESNIEQFVFLYDEDEGPPAELLKYKRLLSERSRGLRKIIDEKVQAMANLENVLRTYRAQRNFIKLKVMQKFGVGALMFGSGQ